MCFNLQLNRILTSKLFIKKRGNYLWDGGDKKPILPIAEKKGKTMYNPTHSGKNIL